MARTKAVHAEPLTLQGPAVVKLPQSLTSVSLPARCDALAAIFNSVTAYVGSLGLSVTAAAPSSAQPPPSATVSPDTACHVLPHSDLLTRRLAARKRSRGRCVWDWVACTLWPFTVQLLHLFRRTPPDVQHAVPIANMGIFQHVVDARQILRDPFSDATVAAPKAVFGNPFARKAKSRVRLTKGWLFCQILTKRLVCMRSKYCRCRPPVASARSPCCAGCVLCLWLRQPFLRCYYHKNRTWY